MTDSIKKIPNWVWSALWQAILLVFALGVASERYAPKAWVEEKIGIHASQSEAKYNEDMRDIKDALKRIEERQYEQAKKR